MNEQEQFPSQSTNIHRVVDESLLRELVDFSASMAANSSRQINGSGNAVTITPPLPPGMYTLGDSGQTATIDETGNLRWVDALTGAVYQPIDPVAEAKYRREKQPYNFMDEITFTK